MNDKMAMFLFELAQKGAKARYRDLPMEFTILNPYNQFPKHVRKPAFMDRPHGPGYKTYPELSRPGLPVILGAAMRTPLFLAVAIPAGLAMTINYLDHGSFGPRPSATRDTQVRNDPSSLYMQSQ